MTVERNSEECRRSLSRVRSVVVKLGTQLMTNTAGQTDEGFLASIGQQIATLRSRGVRVTVVSSGAIGAGLKDLGLSRRPADLSQLQAVAAVGQRRLMDAWATALAPSGLKVAQMLLTREDIEHRTRFLNLRNTIHAAHALGAIPIINENDTVSTDEIVRITFGDNDILAALVAQALRAELLVLLSVVDGVLDASGRPIRWVDSLDRARELVRSEKSPLGKGGMNSKLEAAKLVTDSGETMVLANGRMPDVLVRLIDGDEVGTLFAPAARKRNSRSRWIGSVRPAGTITIDAGAVKALTSGHKSLLAAGVTGVVGDFEPGDVVSVVDPEGRTIARGLSNYSAADVARIGGKKTTDVRKLLGEAAYDEVIHRDNLVAD